MAIKINNTTVIDDSRKGFFDMLNIGRYTSDQLRNKVVTGTDIGDCVYNTTINDFSFWDGTDWGGVSYATAAGGILETPGGGYRYHIFTSPGSFTVANGELTADYMLIGGGGSGGSYGNPGGYRNGGKGNSTTFRGEVAQGGGGGVAYSQSAAPQKDGGSGGGMGGNAPAGNGNGYNYPSPFQQGTPGGNGTNVDGGGGGGGAGAGGQTAPNGNQPGRGGNGRVAFGGDTDLPASYGTPGPSLGRWFAGGGGGGGRKNSAEGGAGGGGNGGYRTRGNDGVANTGGGGGAGDNGSGAGHGGGGAGGFIEKTAQPFSPGTYNVSIGSGSTTGTDNSGNGGSGIVIIRYLM